MQVIGKLLMGEIDNDVLYFYNSRKYTDTMDLDKAIKRMMSMLFYTDLLLILYLNNSLVRMHLTV